MIVVGYFESMPRFYVGMHSNCSFFASQYTSYNECFAGSGLQLTHTTSCVISKRNSIYILQLIDGYIIYLYSTGNYKCIKTGFHESDAFVGLLLLDTKINTVSFILPFWDWGWIKMYLEL